MIRELNHVGIVVRDLESSLRFYQGVLGAEVVFRSAIAANGTDIVYLQISGGMIELLYRPDPPDDEVFGITHVAFLTNDLDTDYSRLIGAGYTGLLEPRVAGSGVGRLAFLTDPDGARVELIQRDLAIRKAPIDHPVIRAFDHYSVVTNDRDDALSFYGQALHLTPMFSFADPASGLQIDYLHYDYDVIELVHGREQLSGPGLSHIALRVDDVEAALIEFARLGVQPIAGTPTVDDLGIGRKATILDPDGVAVELLDRPDLRTL